jgi:hypothetical protein
MLIVALRLPGGDEGSASAEQTEIVVIEESEEEARQIRMEFNTRWHGTDCERQKAVVERKIGDGGPVGRKWWRGGVSFWNLEWTAPRPCRLPEVTDITVHLICRKRKRGNVENRRHLHRLKGPERALCQSARELKRRLLLRGKLKKRTLRPRNRIMNFDNALVHVPLKRIWSSLNSLILSDYPDLG